MCLKLTFLVSCNHSKNSNKKPNIIIKILKGKGKEKPKALLWGARESDSELDASCAVWPQKVMDNENSLPLF